MDKICPENPYILLLRAFCDSHYGESMKSIAQYVQNLLTFLLFACFILFYKNKTKKDRMKESNPFTVIMVSCIWQKPNISRFHLPKICVQKWPPGGPIKGRDDKGHVSVVSLEALLLMTGASLARPCQYNSYVSYLLPPLLFTLRACNALFMLPRRYIEFYFDTLIQYSLSNFGRLWEIITSD